MKGARYDALDYADELREMTCVGMPSKEFIERSNPGVSWFRRKVIPVATLAMCHTCKKCFNPSKTGTILECQKPRCSVGLDMRNKHNPGSKSTGLSRT